VRVTWNWVAENQDAVEGTLGTPSARMTKSVASGARESSMSIGKSTLHVKVGSEKNHVIADGAILGGNR